MSDSNSCRLIFKKTESLLQLINLINGYFRTPKIEALHRIITWFNSTRSSEDSIPLLGLDDSPLSSNSWLSGILDADCYFYFHSKSGKKGFPSPVDFYMRISQRQEYHKTSQFNSSYLPIMDKIATFLSSKVTIIDRNKPNYRELAHLAGISEVESKDILFKYLNEFPLFSYKHFAVIGQYQSYRLVITKDYKRSDGNDQFLQLKKLMNYNSSVFTWAHLDQFYKY